MFVVCTVCGRIHCPGMEAAGSRIVEPGCHFGSIINLGRTKLDFTEGQGMKHMARHWKTSLRVNLMFVI